MRRSVPISQSNFMESKAASRAPRDNSGRLRDQVRRRILLLITDLEIGGTPTVVRELAVRLQKDPDFDVHVACLTGSGPVADQLRNRGIPVTALNARSRLDARIVFRLIRLIRQEKIDTVFSFLIHANAIAAAASLFVRDVRFLQSIQTTQPNPRWHWMLQHAIRNAAERIAVPSPSVAEAAIKWAHVAPEKLLVIPNAVQMDDLSNKPLEKSGKRIGFIGRLDPIKRIQDLLAALALLKSDFSLDIFGEGSERKRIEEVIAHMGLQSRVVMHGATADSHQALSKMDLLVLPSEAEGFGLVLIEAMAAGVPVVGTNVPGIRDVIEDGVSGLLVPPRNPRVLADTIQRVWADESLREKLVTGGKERVRRLYDWSVVYPAYQKLLAHPK
jgi:glycosyltransferase involved in cell wall biosynthesis